MQSKEKIVFNLRLIHVVFRLFRFSRSYTQNGTRNQRLFSWKLFLMLWRLIIVISILFLFFLHSLAFKLFSSECFLVLNSEKRTFFWKKWLLTGVFECKNKYLPLRTYKCRLTPELRSNSSTLCLSQWLKNSLSFSHYTSSMVREWFRLALLSINHALLSLCVSSWPQGNYHVSHKTTSNQRRIYDFSFLLYFLHNLHKFCIFFSCFYCINTQGRRKTLFVVETQAAKKFIARRKVRTSCSLDDRITNTHRARIFLFCEHENRTKNWMKFPVIKKTSMKTRKNILSRLRSQFVLTLFSRPMQQPPREKN